MRKMTEYMTRSDKNGRTRYYKSVDGRLKVISRAEYAASIEAQRAMEAAAVASKPEEVALNVVRQIVSGMDNRDEKKVKMQATRHSVLINYRNCMVCALVFDDEHTVTAIRFMGITLDSRKQVTVCEVRDLREYADRIHEQVEFIDWWWANSSRKKVA